jgi:hypothetical protein
LHDKEVLALALLWLEEVLSFELNPNLEVLRGDELLSSFTCLREILDDEFLDIGVPEKRSKMQPRTEERYVLGGERAAQSALTTSNVDNGILALCQSIPGKVGDNTRI